MILPLLVVGKHICRVDVLVDEHRLMCEDMVLLCNVVNQSYDNHMDVPLVDEH
jgi:hypothetical protein